ncbi:MAG TPA: hypothetical protein VMF04_00130 [Thermoplasmata archaeon]|nr:hypothetical protein [Thermoplasmata archaeon]
MAGSPVPGVFPDGLRQATSVFVAGANRSLLKWAAIALLDPYASRTWWTDVRMEGEAIEPDDPIGSSVVPPERVHVLHPRQLRADEADARRAERAAAVMLHHDESPDSVRRIFEFLKLPEHAQQRIVSTFAGDEPAVLVLANAQRLMGLYPASAVVPMVNSIVDAGACIVVLWSEALPPQRTGFDIVLQVEGSGPGGWRAARLRCEKGLASGPLAHGVTARLDALPAVAAVLEKRIGAEPR